MKKLFSGFAIFVAMCVFWGCNKPVDTPVPVTYSVEYYLESNSGEFYLDYTDIQEGYVGDMTNAYVRYYEGFTAQSFNQKQLTRNGDNTVKIYYDRNYVTFSFYYDEWSDVLWNSISGKYEERVPSVERPRKDGYRFTGWSPSIPEYFSTEDMTFYAQWEEGEELNGFYLDRDYLTLYVGDAKKLYICSEQPYQYDDVIWSSNDSTVARVDEDGNVTAVSIGTATITVTVGSSSAYCIVTVENSAHSSVDSITLDRNTLTLYEGDNRELNYTITPLDAYVSASWSSSDPEVARVEYDGYVYAQSAGEATITVSAGGKTDSCVVTVKAALPELTQSKFRDICPNYQTISEYTVPEEYGRIGNSAFEGCVRLEKVTIGNNITSIGDNAFSGCQWINEIIIGDGAEELSFAIFSSCKNLKTVWLPRTLTSISSSIFNGCENLNDVHFGGAFENWCAISFADRTANPMSSAKHLWLKDENGNEVELQGDKTFPNNLKKISTAAFIGCAKLTSMIIPDSVTEIGEYAFEGCSGLTTMEIPDSVKSIGSGTFSKCSGLVELSLPFVGKSSAGNNTCFSAIFGSESFRGGILVENKSNDNGYYDDWGNYYPSSVSSYSYIPASLEKVTVRGGDVNSYAFYNCSMIKNISIPNSLSINSYVFAGCSSLERINIGDKVVSIYSSAFTNCSSLVDVYYESSLVDWCKIKFANSESNPLNNGANLWVNEEKVTEVEIDSMQNYIDNYVFYNCKSIEKLIIHDSVSSVGQEAFYGCANLKSVTLSTIYNDDSKVPVFESDAFSRCSPDLEIHYTGTLSDWCKLDFSSYDKNPMYYASKIFMDGSTDELTSIEIPSNETFIGDYQFYGFSGVTNVTIPETVKSIGKYAFANCDNLATLIVLHETPLQLGDYSYFLNGSTNSVRICVPYNAVSSYKSASGWSEYSSKIYANVSDDTLVDIEFDTTPILLIPGNNKTLAAKGLYGNNMTLKDINVTWTSSNDSVATVTNGTVYSQSDADGTTTISVEKDGIEKSVTVYVSSSLTQKIFRAMNPNYESMTEYEIPEGVTSIGDTAFEFCSSLKSVTIPSSVTSIGRYAFNNCHNLENAIFEAPAGWCRKYYYSNDACSISNLTDSSQAAYYLRYYYSDYDWYRDE